MCNEKLSIISDTAVFTKSNGKFCGYEPVVKEIDYFLKEWGQIYWLAYKQSSKKTIYSSELSHKINVNAISPLGGHGFINKLLIFLKYFNLFYQVYKTIKHSNYVHVRAPSHPSICAMLIAPFFPNKRFWFKYAGSWIDQAPFSYRIQRFLLKKISKNYIYTTVNGKWSNLNENILSFENPCFSQKDYDKSCKDLQINLEKKELELIYIGSLSKFKGVHLVINALEQMKFNGIKSFKIVGQGDYENKLKKQTSMSVYKNKIKFLGYQKKSSVFKLLNKSDLLIIASETEGFPKVIAEAMKNYCVPISSRVSCIDQYINEETGFLIEKNTTESIKFYFQLSQRFEHYN